MGRAKAWLPWRGNPLLSHVVEILCEVLDEVLVVAAPDQEIPEVGVRVVEDREPGLGPLAGIREGLAAASTTLAFVTAVDAPLLTPAFVSAMLARRRSAAISVDGYLQTLAAVYPTSAAERAEALLAAGRRRPRDLLESITFESLAPDSLPDPQAIRGFNTPDEYLAAVRGEEPGATAKLEFMGAARLAVGRRDFEVPVGTLAELLSEIPSEKPLLEGDRIARPFIASLEGRSFVRDARIPIGMGEQVILLDASAGG
jgi:molybdopterin-guanine dinucleotide biosynthesis protein A